MLKDPTTTACMRAVEPSCRHWDADNAECPRTDSLFLKPFSAKMHRDWDINSNVESAETIHNPSLLRSWLILLPRFYADAQWNPSTLFSKFDNPYHATVPRLDGLYLRHIWASTSQFSHADWYWRGEVLSDPSAFKRLRCLRVAIESDRQKAFMILHIY